MSPKISTNSEQLTRWTREDSDGRHLTVIQGDACVALKSLSEESVDCVITSPPYFSQRDYGVDGQIGLEGKIDEYVTAILKVMEGVKRVLKKDGVLFLNLGDTYYSGKGRPHGNDRKHKSRRLGLRAVDASGLGVPQKTAIGIPWRVALEMIERGWTLRSPIVWYRPGSIPEPSAHDRPWRTYEHVFLFSVSRRYYFNRSGLPKGEEDVWTISARPDRASGGISAPFPEALVERCIECGCPANGTVLDPFAGSGTVLRVAKKYNLSATCIELNPIYCEHIVKELE